jgi:hypothetical protein
VAGYGENYAYGLSPLYKDIPILGVSIFGILLYLMPNWKYPVSLKYKFETVIQFKRRKSEQRKAMRALPTRVLSFVVTNNERHSFIWHYLMSIHADSFLLPLYNEPCKPDRSNMLIGETIINFENDISSYYNLNKFATQIVLIDLRDFIEAEVYTINKIHGSAKAIEITQPVAGVFLKESTIIFPLFRIYLTKKNRTDFSDTMSKIDLEFTEYK